eukprot:5074002-Prymnesium_polylepis.1
MCRVRAPSKLMQGGGSDAGAARPTTHALQPRRPRGRLRVHGRDCAQRQVDAGGARDGRLPRGGARGAGGDAGVVSVHRQRRAVSWSRVSGDRRRIVQTLAFALSTLSARQCETFPAV